MSATASAICISLNGEERHLPDGTSVALLLSTLGLDGRKVAVERNEEIVPRSTYQSTTLAPGDQLEIVHFIGGG
jgi:thiamine biosynthesis protein ThiS